MSKYINADKLIQHLDDKYTFGDVSREWHDAVEQELNWADSADVVEVVRCKDCKWWGVYDEPIRHCRLGMLRPPVREYEFCCKGERKETK